MSIVTFIALIVVNVFACAFLVFMWGVTPADISWFDFVGGLYPGHLLWSRTP